MQLILRKKSEEILSFSLHRGLRVFYISFASVIMIFLYLINSGETSNLGPVVITVICLLFGSYDEVWVFDKTRGVAEISQRLLIVFNVRTVSLENLKNIQISSFTKGLAGHSDPLMAPQGKKRLFAKQFCKLTLITNNETNHDIEILDKRHLKDLEIKAGLISQFCAVELVQ